jgi:hypothetical protein
MAALHELILRRELKEQEDFYFSVLRESIEERNEIEIFEDLISNRKNNRIKVEDYDPFFIVY